MYFFYIFYYFLIGYTKIKFKYLKFAMVFNWPKYNFPNSKKVGLGYP